MSNLEVQLASIAEAFNQGKDKVFVQPEDGLREEAEKRGWELDGFCESTHTMSVKRGMHVQ
ncbi:MAG: hypothetical protein KGQ41_03065 [Alphaproteobacteria bacterium]|nr:hypothetical protein [Alphaproteobacteria bacterium]